MVPLGELYVTHEMAVSVGEPDMEGQPYEFAYAPCTCCNGDFENCPMCEVRELRARLGDWLR